MSDADRDAQLAEAWDAGASGFISRQADLPAIVAALNEAASGKHLFTPAQLRRIQLWRQATGRQLKSLSPRERDVRVGGPRDPLGRLMDSRDRLRPWRQAPGVAGLQWLFRVCQPGLDAYQQSDRPGPHGHPERKPYPGPHGTSQLGRCRLVERP
jgi:hypothetical protein